MTLPTLTCAVLTYKRPWYTIQTLTGLLNHLQYDGELHYLISDGGSPDWHLSLYHELMQYVSHEILQVQDGDVTTMTNLVAERSGEVWMVVLDDFVLTRTMNVTNDVEFLLANEDVGHIRYGNMNSWDVPSEKVYAELRNIYRIHYWVLDKERCTSSVMWTMGFSMMHRRMWDAYGPIARVGAHQPGYCENQMNNQFHTRVGPTIAVPMRIGQESDMKIPIYQPIAHIGHVRTDEYTERWNQRWGAT